MQICKTLVSFNLMLKCYKYPLKVWLTTIILGTLLLYLVNLFHYFYAGPEYEQFHVVNTDEPVQVILAYNFLHMIGYYVFISIPCWLFVWWTFWQTKKRNLSRAFSKSLVLASGLTACLIIICILYRAYESPLFTGNLDVFFSYAFVLVIAVLSFKFDQKDPIPAQDKN